MLVDYAILHGKIIGGRKAVRLHIDDVYGNGLTTAKNWSDRFTMLSFEGQYQLLLDEIRKLSYLRYLLDYEHELKSWSAEQTMDCYVELLKAEMLRASNRKQYWSVIQHLKKISKLLCQCGVVHQM